MSNHRTDPSRPDPAPAWECWRNPTHSVSLHEEFGWPVCLDCGASPSYADRFTHLDPDLALPVFVPSTPHLPRVEPRSAIVGPPRPRDTGRAAVHLEGWVNGPAQYGDRDARGLWGAGVEHAAGRLVVDYPTTAKVNVHVSDLTRVGTFWPVQRRLVVDEPGILDAWLGAAREDD